MNLAFFTLYVRMTCVSFSRDMQELNLCLLLCRSLWSHLAQIIRFVPVRICFGENRPDHVEFISLNSPDTHCGTSRVGVH